MSLKELKQRARSEGVVGFSRMKKAELEAALEKALGVNLQKPKSFPAVRKVFPEKVAAVVDLSFNQVIRNLPLPTAATQAASKEYVDISGIFSILGQATATYVDGYIKENAECLYSVERGTKEEVFFWFFYKSHFNFDRPKLCLG